MNLVSIQCLPEEVFEHIAGYLNKNDIEACFNVCFAWKHYLNKNKIWKRICLYPEKYLKACVTNKANEENCNNDICIWKHYYDCEQNISNSLCKGKYIIENTGISMSLFERLFNFVDDYGQYWLFDINKSTSKISMYNYTKTPTFHQEIHDGDELYQIWRCKDKIMACCCKYVKVFLFRYPNYDLKLQYLLKFNMDEVLPVNSEVSDDSYLPGTRFVCVGSLFVGYNENITGFHESMLHIWDLDSAKKIATKNIYQQTFADFVLSKSGKSIVSNFVGGLVLFEGNDKQFLITLIDDTSELCQVTIYDTDSMSFLNVIAQLESRTAWCSMKKDVIAIYHTKGPKSYISVYDVKSILLAKLDLYALANPMLNHEFWFDGSQMFLITSGKVEVLYFSSVKTVRHNFTIDDKYLIMNYFHSKFLLLYKELTSSGNICRDTLLFTIWDAEEGVKLWTLPDFELNYSYLSALRIMFPNRLLVQLKNEDKLSVLKYEIA